MWPNVELHSGILILEEESGEERLDTEGHLAVSNLNNDKRLMDILSKYRNVQK